MRTPSATDDAQQRQERQLSYDHGRLPGVERRALRPHDHAQHQRRLPLAGGRRRQLLHHASYGNFGEPDGAVATTGSLQYTLYAGWVIGMSEVAGAGATSSRFLCDVGDKDPPKVSCDDYYDSGFWANGNAEIDPDGSGAGAPYTVYCDHDHGGGWMRVGYDTFEAATTGWSPNNTRTTCGGFGFDLGGYNTLGGNSTASKTYQWTAFTHTQARVDIDYIKLDSWDGETASLVLAGSTVWSEQFCQPRPELRRERRRVRRRGGVRRGVGRGSQDERVAHHQPHHLEPRGRREGDVDQATNDESFGVDNVYVFIK